MVRIITHNLLACHVKKCNANNFPLQFKDPKIEVRETELNPEFLKGFMPKIEWKALVDTARDVSVQYSLLDVMYNSGFLVRGYISSFGTARNVR